MARGAKLISRAEGRPAARGAAECIRLRAARPGLLRRGMGRHLPPLVRASRIGMLVMAMTVPARLGNFPTAVQASLPPLAITETAAPTIPRPEPLPSEGLASWYSETDRGIRPTTASMERFDDRQMTCAIWDVPFNTRLRVTNIANGRSVIVRVNDRGPARHLRQAGRIVDLTRTAFAQIAPLEQGLTSVRVEIMPLERGTSFASREAYFANTNQ